MEALYEYVGNGTARLIEVNDSGYKYRFSVLVPNHSLTFTPIKSGDKVFFHKQCKFPRKRLINSGLSRVIKESSADVIIIPQAFEARLNTLIGRSRGEIQIDDNGAKSINRNSDSIYEVFTSTIYAETESEFTSLVQNEITVEKLFPWEVQLLFDILDNKITKYNVPSAVIPFLGMPTVDTREDVDSLISMLSSSDSDVKSLGITTLVSYDLSQTPGLAKYLFAKYIKDSDCAKIVEYEMWKDQRLFFSYLNPISLIKDMKSAELLSKEMAANLIEDVTYRLRSIPQGWRLPEEFTITNILLSEDNPYKRIKFIPKHEENETSITFITEPKLQ